MGVDINALRASMRQAQVFGKGQYILNGKHSLEVIKLFHKRTMIEGVAKENIICEFKVLASTNPEMQIGSTRSCVFAFHHKGWLPRLKALLLALVGVDPDGRIPPEAEEATTDIYVAMIDDEERKRLQLPENCMAGRIVDVEGFPGQSQKGTPVTNLKWSPVKDITQ